MSAKTYNQPVRSEILDDVTNGPVFKPWTSFDSFFHEYCRKNDINPKWKAMVEQHLKEKGFYADQQKWLDGLKHFGI